MILRNHTNVPCPISLILERNAEVCIAAGGYPEVEGKVIESYLPHAQECQICNLIVNNTHRRIVAMRQTPKRSFFGTMVRDTLVGLGVQVGFHAIGAAKQMLFDSYRDKCNEMHSGKPDSGQPTPKIDNANLQMQRDVARIRRSVTGSNKQWPMPGEDKGLV